MTESFVITPGHEVYASAAAFGEHLQTQHVNNFIAAVPAFSTAGSHSPG